MHIEPVVQTYTVTLTRKEIQLIAYGLTLHAANKGTQTVNVEACKNMATSFTNALKSPHAQDQK